MVVQYDQRMAWIKMIHDALVICPCLSVVSLLSDTCRLVC